MRCDPVEATAPVHRCIAVCGCNSRRTFLKSIGAFGAAATLSAPAVWAQGSSPAPSTAKPHRVDVHHHMFPPFLQERWKKDNVRTIPVVMRWTLEGTLAEMEQGRRRHRHPVAGERRAQSSQAERGREPQA